MCAAVVIMCLSAHCSDMICFYPMQMYMYVYEHAYVYEHVGLY